MGMRREDGGGKLAKEKLFSERCAAAKVSGTAFGPRDGRFRYCITGRLL